MSKITVNLGQPESNNAPPAAPNLPKSSAFGNAPTMIPPVAQPVKKKRRGILIKILLVLGVLILLAAIAAGIGGYWWWTSLQKSQAYSLALLIDAARKDEKAEVEKYLDTNAVVDDFVPQIMEKAKERYGRGFPPAQVQQATQRAQTLLQTALPGIKERAKQEIPRLIRDRAKSVPESVSPWILAMVIGRVIKVEQNGDTATVKTELQARQVELKMQKNGDRWKIVGLKDDALADTIANNVAQKILEIVNQRQTSGKKPIGKDLIKELENQIQLSIP